MKTFEQWQARSKSLKYCHQAFINGQFQAAQSKETFATINPANEHVLADVSACDEADVNIAVANALQVFNEGTWSALAPAQRKETLLKWADLIEQHQDEFALIDTQDMGKSITEMLEIDLPEALDCLRWTAESIDKIFGQIAPTASDILTLIHHEPVGVVAAITPWNYPLLMAMWKLAPALAAGNSIVLKPSEKSPLSALLLAKLAHQV